MGGLTKLLSDINFYIAIALSQVEGFFGPTYNSLLLIGITALVDVAVGYYKNKKTKGEKFNFSKVYAKLSQLGQLIVVIFAAVVSDVFFQNKGMSRFWVASQACDIFAIWQFLHIVDNVAKSGGKAAMWLVDLKELILNRVSGYIKTSQSKTLEELKEDKGEEDGSIK